VSELVGQINQDVQIAARLPRRIEQLFRQLIAPLALPCASFLFDPQRRRKHNVGQPCRLTVCKNIGDSQEALLHASAVTIRRRQGLRRIGTHQERRLHPSVLHGAEEIDRIEAGLVGNRARWHPPEILPLTSMLLIGNYMPGGQQV